MVLVSALGETLEHASLPAARKVFVDGFLASRKAYEVEIPRVSLDEIFNRRAADWLTERNVAVHLGRRVGRIEGDAGRAVSLVLADDSRRQFDFFVIASPWWTVRSLFSDRLAPAMTALEGLDNLEPSPITAVHLWFDRPITRLSDAALVGRTSQWFFNCQQNSERSNDRSHYCQVVISASRDLAGRRKQDVVGEVKEELAAIWPAAREAALLRWRMVTNPAAVFSVGPGTDQLRPPQRTPVKNLVLAGDWTSTGWPATMEGAVRSGYLAAEEILRTAGRGETLLVPDLRRGVLSRWMIADDFK